MSEVSDVAIKRTQDTLGKIIKKPVLTEKLLKKPPFKFLHDIIHAVIDTTGFLDGLYTAEELQSENIKDREAKIAFLQKTIEALKLATQQEVRARPSKIVAGLEADKTNELLLAVARAVDRKIDTTEAVALVKHGNVSNSPQKETKTTKTQAKSDSRRVKKDTKETTAPKKSKTIAGSDTKASRKSDSNVKVSKQSSKESTDSKKAKTKSPSKGKEREKKSVKKEEKVAEKVPTSESIEPKTEAPQTNGYHQNDIMKNQEPKPNVTKIESAEKIVKQNDMPKQQTEKLVNFEKENEKPEKREKTPKTPEKRVKERVEAEKVEITRIEKATPKSSASLERNKSTESVSNETSPPAVAPVQEKTEKPDKVESVEKVDKHSSDKPRSSRTRRSHSKPDLEKSIENGTVKPEEKFKSSHSVDKLIERPLDGKSNGTTNKQSKPPRTALRSAAVRPISARPSAPRRRDRKVRQIIHTESFVQDSGDSNKTDKKSTMPEFDDADNIVITETIPDNISAIDDPIANNGEGEIDGKQGHLVQQILETQTAILKSDAKNDVSAVTDESILNDRKSITRNMTELRKMIQKLSLYITPLGKMMEYFQEDVDAMQIELLMWQKAGETAAAEIQGEQQITEKMLEAFKYSLAEINNSIKDHAEQINNTTMNIIQNEEKISKLISSL